jgi:hypothetical protein
MLSRMTLKGYGRTVHVGSKHDLTCFEAHISHNKVSVLEGGFGVPVNQLISFINKTLSPLQQPISMTDMRLEGTFSAPCDTPCPAPPLENCLHMYAAIVLAEKYGLRPFLEGLRNYAIMY